MADNTKLFKQCMSKFATGLTIVTTKFNKQNIGLTINSFNSVSLNPLLILFSLNKKAHFYNEVTNCENFTVNILSNQQTDLVSLFANHKNNQWANLELDTTNSITSSPALKNSLAFLECSIYAKYEGGDHTIIVGKVINMFNDKHEKPLIYYQGKILNND